MSMILDALRRADAQRERPGPPGLHAPAPLLPGDDAERAPVRWRLLAWSGAGLLVVAAVAWLATRPGAEPARVAPVAAHSQTATGQGAGALARGPAGAIEPPPRPGMIRASEPASDGASSRRPPSQAPAASDAASQAQEAPGAPDPAQETLSRDQRLQPQPLPQPSSAAPLPPPGVASPAPPGAVRASPPMVRPSSPAAAAAPAGPPRVSALPPDAPQVSVSGGVYSRERAQRMVIINGQVHGEGAQPVQGLTIEQIEPDRAILGWKGQRYTVPY